MINMLEPEESALRATISENLYHLLADQGRTPYWLAKEMGVGPGALDHILKRRNTPSAWFLVRAAKSLGVTVNDLVTNPLCEITASREKTAATA